MDELLESRVEQLKQIDDGLERMIARGHDNDVFQLLKQLSSLRGDIKDMIAEAERQHAEF